MNLRSGKFLRIIWLLSLPLFFLSSCALDLSDCAGPLVNTEKLLQMQDEKFLVGPQAFLVLPNPIDSNRLKSFQLNSSTFQSAQEGVGLPNLQSHSALENSFLKVRLHTRYDSTSTLVNQSSLSSASRDFKDPQYSQVMAYHAITSIMDFVKSLGFSVDQSRELFVLVRSFENPEDLNSSEGTQQPNAYYVHNKDHPTKPRYIQLFGNIQYPLGADRDMFWHEFGHLFNESLTASRGIDEASDQGAYYTEAGAIHECIADYLAESAGQKGDIGRWFQKNRNNLGQPLRSAISVNDDKNQFSSVSTFSASLGIPDKYRVAEWCSRVLWDLRSQFLKEDKKSGALFADRAIFSAVSLLGKNTSMTELRTALINADKNLHCGLHQKSIQKAFAVKGLLENPAALTRALTLNVTPVGVSESGSPVAPTSAANEIYFLATISNPNGVVARNVRLEVVSSKDPAVLVLQKMQGFGDLPGGQTVKITQTDQTVSVSLDGRYTSGRKKVQLLLRVLSENGPITTIPVELNL